MASVSTSTSVHAANSRASVQVGLGHRRGVQPSGVDGRVAELVAGREHPQEADVRGEAEDRRVVERVDQGTPGRLPVGAVDDHLAEHGVVGRRDHLAALERRVDARVPTPPHERRGARLWEEVVPRVLGVDARLDRVTMQRHLVLGERQRFPGRDRQLEPHQVQVPPLDPDRQLGDGVLDLEPGVHLEEVGLAGAVVRSGSSRNSTVPAFS